MVRPVSEPTDSIRSPDHEVGHVRSAATPGGGAHRKLRFGPFELSNEERVLRRDGVQVALGGRALDILTYLAERPGTVIAKKELIHHVWSGVTVEEGSLRVHISAIRKVLGDGHFGNRYIANVQGRGYSFVGAVVSLEESAVSGSDQLLYRGNLPARLPRMIGRDQLVQEVRDKLREDRFVTLLGPGGIGKTTVAIATGHALAAELNEEVYFVDLGSITDQRSVAGAIGKSLGVALKSSDAWREVINLVHSRKLLIILDSCEHVIETVASVAEKLFHESAQVHLLATSREPLKVDGERCYHVPSLDFPLDGLDQTTDAVLRYPAVQLFVDLVAAKDENFILRDGDAPFAAEMCRNLDGIPLAIELAASRVAAVGVKNTVTRLLSRLELLKLGRRTAVPRHQTLKATFDWSYELLSEVERIVFRRVAPFVGHFALPAAMYAADQQGLSKAEISDAIAGLVEKSLITSRLSEGQPKYRLLDTTRAYALEKLEEHAELVSSSRRHAEYVTEHLESQRDALSTLPRSERLAAYSGQLSNVRAALNWSFGPQGDDEIATRLAAASTQMFLELSLLIECQLWAERAIGRLGNQFKNSRREMEICASLPFALMYIEGNNDRVRAAFSRALDVTIAQGDLAYELRLLSGLFRYCYSTMDIHGALDIAARSKKIALKTQDPDDVALADAFLGATNHVLGNHLVAQQHFESSLSHSTTDSRFRAGLHLFNYTSFSLAGMARSLLYKGLIDQSKVFARLAIEEAEKSGRPATLCRTLAAVLPVFLAVADFGRSAKYISQMSDLSATYSLLPYRAAATGLEGQCLVLQGNLAEGIPLLRKGLEELRNQRNEILRMDFICDLGAALIVIGEHGEAYALNLAALDAQQRAGAFLHMPALLRMKGLILASRSAEENREAEKSLLLSIDWAKSQSAGLFELKAATDLAELLLAQGRILEANKHLGAALRRTPDGLVSPAHERARQTLNKLRLPPEQRAKALARPLSAQRRTSTRGSIQA
jgi:predicted ATPase/DNA-binding winged helix-turn-helix (wHTH) protein/tetratricopeptide (TPR) repeat protein